MFRVMYWENQFEKGNFPQDQEYNEIQTHSRHETLKEAKKVCRNLGHTGEDSPMFKSYPPIAFVANENFELVYNPLFRKEL